MVGLEARPRHPGLDAALATAPAGWARIFRRFRPGQRIVTPLAAGAPRPVDQLAVDQETAAAAGTEDHTKQRTGAGASTVNRLRQRKAVGIIGEPKRVVEPASEVVAEPLAVEPGRIRVLHLAPGCDRARHADADGTGATYHLFEAPDHQLDGGDGRLIIVLRGGHTLAGERGAVAAQHDTGDLGATKVDADAQRGA